MAGLLVMVAYEDNLEGLARHAARVIKALQSEREFYTRHPDGVTLVADLDTEIQAARDALDLIADARHS